ncbi:MAG TPA: bifunctional 5,10-methylenetetrahydrofolate dehydrogenase/5,10-methenyltetrahydrofolate cyclohydrolase [Candidatus Dormibacteraeota bacterium]|nr:bifunctional 5,10-methylenetetrahydrofolate dehydrogenase/5,10-methenyltetrahydrofolate cyclohydrolase [Candidatus Dormibacteraeota bacterium]
MTARVMDGRALAAQIFEDIAAQVAARVAEGKPPPALATILVGDDPASATYVRAKQRNAARAGIGAQDHRLPASTTTEQLTSLVAELNADDTVSGVLIQQPVPAQIDMTRVIAALDPVKDVDGFHPVNAGLVSLGLPGAVEPCTPAGIIELLRHSGVQLAGANAVIVGRSNLVGKPVALLLLKQNATVTICHTKTRDLAAHTRSADILIAAAGKLGLISKDMVKPRAAVVDVGASWVDGRQVGDLGPGVDEVAGWLTPNPGGVGPMTRAMLIRNTFQAEARRRP